MWTVWCATKVSDNATPASHERTFSQVSGSCQSDNLLFFCSLFLYQKVVKLLIFAERWLCLAPEET